MNNFFDSPFFPPDQPFLQNIQGWKIFLRIRKTTSDHPAKFHGAIVIEAGHGGPVKAGLIQEKEYPKYHLDPIDATLDAIQLSHAAFAAIDAALNTSSSTYQTANACLQEPM